MEAFVDLNLYEGRLLVSWIAAAIFAGGLRLRGTPWHRAVGAAVMTVPLWLVAVNYVNTIELVIDRGSVLGPYSKTQLSSIWSRSLLRNAGYVLLGLLVWSSGGSWRGLWDNGPRRMARHVSATGLPTGAGEQRSIMAGVVIFPVFLLVTYFVNAFVYGQDLLVSGDESSVFANMTPYHALMLALAAGFGEEILYRGVLLTGLRRVIPLWAAVLVQAVIFGLAHAGYGTYAHVILPTLFGLVAGFLAARWGLWAAIVLHVFVNLVAFSMDAVDTSPWLLPVILGLLAVNAVATLAFAARWTRERYLARHPS